LAKEKVKENSAIVYILTKNNGVLKCYLKGIFRPQSKNLSLFEPGNINRLFILTDFTHYQIISALPLKITTKIFKLYPYLFLWTLILIKNLKLIETPKFIWFTLTHLESYIHQNPKNFPFWFLFHLLKELGYEIDLESCSRCQRKLKNFAFFDKKNSIFCLYCKEEKSIKINKNDLILAKKIKNLTEIPKEIPEFIKKMILGCFSEIFQKNL